MEGLDIVLGEIKKILEIKNAIMRTKTSTCHNVDHGTIKNLYGNHCELFKKCINCFALFKKKEGVFGVTVADIVTRYTTMIMRRLYHTNAKDTVPNETKDQLIELFNKGDTETLINRINSLIVKRKIVSFDILRHFGYGDFILTARQFKIKCSIIVANVPSCSANMNNFFSAS